MPLRVRRPKRPEKKCASAASGSGEVAGSNEAVFSKWIRAAKAEWVSLQAIRVDGTNHVFWMGVHISHFLGIVPSNYTIASQWDMRDAGMRDMSVFSVFFCDLLEWDVS